MQIILPAKNGWPMLYWPLLFLISGCSITFGERATLSAKGTYYELKFESPNWDQKKEDRSDYVFTHKSDGRIMLANSFCDKFQEESLEHLATKTFRPVDHFRPIKGHYTAFNDREAYRMSGSGTVNGIKVELMIQNTRRNNCYFDFVSISPENSKPLADNDFQLFLDSAEFK